MLIFNGISCSVIRLITLCLFRLLLIKQKIIKFNLRIEEKEKWFNDTFIGVIINKKKSFCLWDFIH